MDLLLNLITWECPLGDTGVFTTMVSVARRGSDWLILVLALGEMFTKQCIV